MDGDWEFLWFEPREFEWNHEKAESNRQKHGVSFEEATKVFAREILTQLQTHGGEERYAAIGFAGAKALVVVFTERQGRIRIISARKAAPSERRWHGAHFL